MQFEGAVITEQGVTFGVVIVKPHILNSPSERSGMVRFGQTVFGRIPIVLMKQDAEGTPTYWGRSDIVNFLASVHLSQIPWQRYTVRAA